MSWKTKTLFITIFIVIFACKPHNKERCIDITLTETYYKKAQQQGSLKLFAPLDCPRAENLNKIILRNSELIFIATDVTDQATYLDRIHTSEIFSTDSLAYSQQYEAGTLNLTSNISTTAYFTGDVLSYIIRLDISHDKGAPYYEYINLNISKGQLLVFSDLLIAHQQKNMANTLFSYAENHKDEITANYRYILAEMADPLLYGIAEKFADPAYSLTNVQIEGVDINDFLYFNDIGAVFNVRVIDRNFTSDSQARNYTSFLVLPFKQLRPYLKQKVLASVEKP